MIKQMYSLVLAPQRHKYINRLFIFHDINIWYIQINIKTITFFILATHFGSSLNCGSLVNNNWTMSINVCSADFLNSSEITANTQWIENNIFIKHNSKYIIQNIQLWPLWKVNVHNYQMIRNNFLKTEELREIHPSKLDNYRKYCHRQATYQS
jgi:hypothetical protein